MERREFPRLGEVCYFYRLENGLPVYIVPKPGYVRRYASLAVFCGGMHRRFSRAGAPPEELPSGATCLLAHMISAGGEGSALRALAAAGVSAGVRTAPDVTVYHISCTQSFSSHLRTLLRALTTPQFSSDRVAEALRGAAAELDGREKDPRAAVCDYLLRALYSQRPISESRSDTRASLSRISPQALARCYDALYCPGNMALCITGEVDPHQMIALARMMLPESSAPPARPATISSRHTSSTASSKTAAAKYHIRRCRSTASGRRALPARQAQRRKLSRVPRESRSSSPRSRSPAARSAVKKRSRAERRRSLYTRHLLCRQKAQ